MRGCSGWFQQPLSTLSASIEHPLKPVGNQLEKSAFLVIWLMGSKRPKRRKKRRKKRKYGGIICICQKFVVPLQSQRLNEMNEQYLIDAINRSMQKSATKLRALGRNSYSATREEAERQVAMLLKAREDFCAKQN